MSEFILFHDDCLTRLRQLEENSVDSVVTDPPYGLSFMGKKWDYDVPSVEVWAECLRVLKPGGHLLAFAGTRTQHRMAVRIEDAGFEIRDMIFWVYGSGFPKSKNLGNGFGSALKPATEPITMARKPLDGTLEANYAKHGTGAINIDGCRVGTNGGTAKGSKPQGDGKGIYGAGLHGACEIKQLDAGRWPANLIHDGSEEVVAGFPQTAGATGMTKHASGTNAVYGDFARTEKSLGGNGTRDTGSAARYFYCAKASKRDRNSGGVTSTHPTVKPTDLMRYLCRLVTQPGDVVLDPFMGSGSTGKAALLEGFQFIGIEREAEYLEIARARITTAQPAPANDNTDLFGDVV